MEPLDFSGIPDDVLKLSSTDLSDLACKFEELLGMYEFTETGTAEYMRLHRLGTDNLTKALNLREEIIKLRASQKELSQIEHETEEQFQLWQMTESEMNSALAPFSSMNMQKTLNKLYTQRRDEASALVGAFISDKENRDVIKFVNEFRTKQKSLRILQLKLNAISNM